MFVVVSWMTESRTFENLSVFLESPIDFDDFPEQLRWSRNGRHIWESLLWLFCDCHAVSVIFIQLVTRTLYLKEGIASVACAIILLHAVPSSVRWILVSPFKCWLRRSQKVHNLVSTKRWTHAWLLLPLHHQLKHYWLSCENPVDELACEMS